MVISETELRFLLGQGKERLVRVRDGDVITPAARDFMTAHQFRVERAETTAVFREMGRTPIPAGGARRFVDIAGNAYADKPEHMTHLHGNVLVPKTHPRIVFRGKLDSLQAKTLEVQITAQDEDMPGVVRGLDEILQFTRSMLASEVTEVPFEYDTLLGLDADGLRAASHDPRSHCGVGHLIPDCRMGRTVVALNSLRTRVRETELAAMRAFADPEGGVTRPDLLQALNRLSSGVYIVICRILGGYYAAHGMET